MKTFIRLAYIVYRPPGLISVISPRADIDLYHMPFSVSASVHFNRRKIKHFLQPIFSNAVENFSSGAVYSKTWENSGSVAACLVKQ